MARALLTLLSLMVSMGTVNASPSAKARVNGAGKSVLARSKPARKQHARKSKVKAPKRAPAGSQADALGSVSSLAFSTDTHIAPAEMADAVDIYTTRLQGFGQQARIEAIRGKAKQASAYESNSVADTELRRSSRPPEGRLTPVAASKETFKDEAGNVFLLKEALNDLHAASAVIASGAYRHFGYLSPEVHIVQRANKTYIAHRPMPSGKLIGLEELAAGGDVSRMRIVSAFLQDHGLVSGKTKIRVFKDGSFALNDITGCLGSRPDGERNLEESYKTPDKTSAYGVNSALSDEAKRFVKGHPMKHLYESYGIDSLPRDHPWRKVTPKDALATRELFRTFDSTLLKELIGRAPFSSGIERNQLTNSLKVRRNSYFEFFHRYLDRKAAIDSSSYWSQFFPESKLTFDIRSNRSVQIGHDIRQYVLDHPEEAGKMILFRGQEHLTAKVLSPSARTRALEGLEALTSKEVDKLVERQLERHQRSSNWARDDAYKYAFAGVEKTGGDVWLERANPLDFVALDHSKSNGNPLFVSATRALGVASRWVEEGRFPTKYRYVYVLSVPLERTVPITRPLLMKHGSNLESEVAIVHEATRYVKAIYDTVELKFVNIPTTAE